MLIVGNTEAINEAIQVLQQSFEVKAPANLEDYLGVQVIKSKDGEKAWLGQLQSSRAKRRCLMKMSRLCVVH